MKIVFLGKGGSGKTTLATLMSMCALAEGRKLLTIDGDVNIHLGSALGVPSSVPSFGADYQALFALLESDSPAFKRLGLAPECGALPPASWSHKLTLSESDPVLSKIAWRSPKHTWWHTQLGNYGEVDQGGDCYHYKQNALELLMQRIVDSESDLIFTDATAGVDHVATSLSVGYDLCVFAVEPTRKGVSVALDFKRLADSGNIRFVFVGSKIEGQGDVAFLKKNLPADSLVGYVPYIPSLGQAEQGDLKALTKSAATLTELFDSITAAAAVLYRSGRPAQRERLHQIYKKECVGYWNAYHQADCLQFLESEDSPVAVNGVA